MVTIAVVRFSCNSCSVVGCLRNTFILIYSNAANMDCKIILRKHQVFSTVCFNGCFQRKCVHKYFLLYLKCCLKLETQSGKDTNPKTLSLSVWQVRMGFSYFLSVFFHIDVSVSINLPKECFM